MVPVPRVAPAFRPQPPSTGPKHPTGRDVRPEIRFPVIRPAHKAIRNAAGSVEFHVRRVSGGWVSPYIVGHARVGETWVLGSGDWSGHDVQIAGPPAMIQATEFRLQAAGVPADRLRHDPLY